MGELAERINVAEAILKTLSYAPMRRTALEKKVFRTKDIFYSRFSNMFAFLVVDGDIEKVSAEKTAPFRLTEKGKMFLSWRAKNKRSFELCTASLRCRFTQWSGVLRDLRHSVS